MNNQDIAKHSAEMLDLFEAEQQRILLLDPKERAMQHNYQRTMAVCYELRTFIRAIDAKPSAVLEAAPASSAMAMQAVDANIEANVDLLRQRAAVGLKKYGVTTDRTDLNAQDWIQHAIEELLDGANYLQALRKTMQSQQSPVQASSAVPQWAQDQCPTMTATDWDEFKVWLDNKDKASDAGRQG